MAGIKTLLEDIPPTLNETAWPISDTPFHRVLKKYRESGLVLFLVPSIALLGQTLREWKNQCVKPIHAICICSDIGVSKTKKLMCELFTKRYWTVNLTLNWINVIH